MSDEARIENLEIALAHHEATVETLNQTLIEQQRIIETLRERMVALEERVKAAGLSNIAPQSEETPPPHY